MKHEEIKILLHDHINGKLNDHLTTQIEDHLSECNECSQKLNSLKALMKKVDELTRKRKPPEDFWQDIFISISAEKSENLKIKEELDLKEAQVYLAEDKEERDKRNGRIKAEKNLIRKHEKATPRSKKKKSIFIYVMIATISLLAIFLIYNVFFPHAESWKVEKFQIGTDSYSEAFIGLAEDQILKSNRNIRFQIQVSQIGKLFMEPNSKIQRLKNNSIRLFYGSLSAYKINAKQLLTVSVPGAEIKDYFPGGEYKVTTRGQKNSFLEVIDGWVIVKKDNIELIVLPYHDCVIKADSGIGLPFLKSSEEEFIEAIDTYCYTHPGNEEALISVLTKAKLSNSVTLWNLLNRVTRQQRGMVINTIFGLLGGPPLGVTADGLRILDSEMLKKLIKTIESNI